ncbi:hypothetical protein [Prescottella equi]|uniref:hypothetical protein n=1 Tax=Rhodococcus hoagii TaxID=43767 RepID=UPI0007CD4E2B|nr:hypothetical protein [Prescottella equi]
MAGKKRSSSSSVQDWEKAKKIVAENADALKALESHGQIYKWAKDNGVDTGALFKRFKVELHKQLDIDYDAMRDEANALRREQIAAAAVDGPLLEVFTAADGQGSFAVCAPDGSIVSYGAFHPDNTVFKQDDQLSADRAAADHAVFLAGKAREDLDVEAARLRLHVLNHEVDADDPVLVRSALISRVDVTIEVDDTNPADEWTQEAGYKSWRETNLNILLVDEGAEDAAAEGDEADDASLVG